MHYVSITTQYFMGLKPQKFSSAKLSPKIHGDREESIEIPCIALISVQRFYSPIKHMQRRQQVNAGNSQVTVLTPANFKMNYQRLTK